MKMRSPIATEAALLGIAMGGFYLAILHYQIQWQEYFGFEYINLGIEDLAYYGRYMVVPLVASASVYVSFRYFLLERARWGAMVAALLACPLVTTMIYVDMRTFPQGKTLSAIILFSVLYVSAVFRFYAHDAGIFGATRARDENNLLILGAAIGLAGNVVFAYGDLGATHASQEHLFEMVRLEDVPSVILVRDGELMMAAALDADEKKVKAEFRWVKVGDKMLKTTSADLSQEAFWSNLKK